MSPRVSGMVELLDRIRNEVSLSVGLNRYRIHPDDDGEPIDGVEGDVVDLVPDDDGERAQWHAGALATLQNSEVVALTPEWGVEDPSRFPALPRARTALVDEICAYLSRGQSVVVSHAPVEIEYPEPRREPPRGWYCVARLERLRQLWGDVLGDAPEAVEDEAGRVYLLFPAGVEARNVRRQFRSASRGMVEDAGWSEIPAASGRRRRKRMRRLRGRGYFPWFDVLRSAADSDLQDRCWRAVEAAVPTGLGKKWGGRIPVVLGLKDEDLEGEAAPPPPVHEAGASDADRRTDELHQRLMAAVAAAEREEERESEESETGYTMSKAPPPPLDFDEETRPELPTTRACPGCLRVPSELTWLYFTSPRWTWQSLCGRSGWMSICEGCGIQVEFRVHWIS